MNVSFTCNFLYFSIVVNRGVDKNVGYKNYYLIIRNIFHIIWYYLINENNVEKREGLSVELT